MKLNKKGFTLIELVIVIIIIAILAVVAIPRFRDLAGHAREASQRATVVAVRQAITIYRAENELEGITTENPQFPLVLDPVIGSTSPGTEATEDAPFFANIMEVGGGITSGWTKLDDTGGSDGRYRGIHPAGTPSVFIYEADDGSFTIVP